VPESASRLVYVPYRTLIIMQTLYYWRIKPVRFSGASTHVMERTAAVSEGPGYGLRDGGPLPAPPCDGNARGRREMQTSPV
jgi:hypothetical protein